MSEPKLTREEMETVILGNAASMTWDFVTADPKMIRKLQRQGYTPDSRRNPLGYVSFTIPFDRVRIAKAEKRKLPEGHSFLKRTRNSVGFSTQNLSGMV
jgi:hypothetical protein